MLSYRTNTTCECCATPRVRRAYRFHAYRYCLTCLHSIGRNAAGNYCTRRQYADAWRALAGGGSREAQD